MTSIDLTFDAQVHEYRTPDGRRVPSVTEILAAVGVSTDFEALSQMSSRMGAAIDRKRDVGIEVHRALHYWDDDDLVTETVDPAVRPYLDAWITLRANLGLMPTARERRVYHPLGYAGTLDGVFITPTGRRVLLDVKTSAAVEYAHHLQVAAYQLAWELEHPEAPIAERWLAHLTPERRVPYRIVNCSAVPDAWMDGRRFLACLSVFQMQTARRTA